MNRPAHDCVTCGLQNKKLCPTPLDPRVKTRYKYFNEIKRSIYIHGLFFIAARQFVGALEMLNDNSAEGIMPRRWRRW